MTLGRFVHDIGYGDIKRIDLNDIFNGAEATIEELTAAQQLLVRIYTGIYCETFPMPSEREEIREWFYRLYGGEQCNSIQFFSVYGKNLEDPDKAEVVGFVVSEFFKGQGCGIVCYIIREKAYTGILPAKVMADRHEVLMRAMCLRIDGHPLKALFWEANDYRAMMLKAMDRSTLINPVAKNVYTNIIENARNSGEELTDREIADFEKMYFSLHGREYWRDIDCMDPRKRTNHIQKAYGARKVGFYYVQAPLQWCETLEERIELSNDCMGLYVYNAKDYPEFDINDVREYINFFATVFSKAESPEALDLPDVDRMVAQVNTMEAHGISVWQDEQSDAEIDLIYGSKPMFIDPSVRGRRKSQHAA